MDFYLLSCFFVAQELEAHLAQPPQIPAPTGVATPQTKNATLAPTSPPSTIPGTLATMIDQRGFSCQKQQGGPEQKPKDALTPPWGDLPEVLPDRQEDSAFDETGKPPVTPNAQENSDGTQSVQPSNIEAEPLLDCLKDEIPDIRDAFAPSFRPSEHHLSESAIRSRSKRIFTPRVDG